MKASGATSAQGYFDMQTRGAQDENNLLINRWPALPAEPQLL